MFVKQLKLHVFVRTDTDCKATHLNDPLLLQQFISCKS